MVQWFKDSSSARFYRKRFKSTGAKVEVMGIFDKLKKGWKAEKTWERELGETNRPLLNRNAHQRKGGKVAMVDLLLGSKQGMEIGLETAQRALRWKHNCKTF